MIGERQRPDVAHPHLMCARLLPRQVMQFARQRGATTSGAAGAVWLPFQWVPFACARVEARRTREELEQIARLAPEAGVDMVDAASRRRIQRAAVVGRSGRRGWRSSKTAPWLSAWRRGVEDEGFPAAIHARTFRGSRDEHASSCGPCGAVDDPDAAWRQRVIVNCSRPRARRLARDLGLIAKASDRRSSSKRAPRSTPRGHAVRTIEQQEPCFT